MSTCCNIHKGTAVCVDMGFGHMTLSLLVSRLMRAPQHWFVCPAELHAGGCRNITGLQRNAQQTPPALFTVHLSMPFAW